MHHARQQQLGVFSATILENNIRVIGIDPGRTSIGNLAVGWPQ
jgi:hypothetical protein